MQGRGVGCEGGANARFAAMRKRDALARSLTGDRIHAANAVDGGARLIRGSTAVTSAAPHTGQTGALGSQHSASNRDTEVSSSVSGDNSPSCVRTASSSARLAGAKSP